MECRMRKASHALGVCIGVLLIYLVPTMLSAGTTGKIAGRIVNKATGESLPSVNVQIVGESLGAATDL
jgi:hypothetical protein